MKTLFANGHRDFVIDEYQFPIRDNKGKYIYTDVGANVGKHKGAVREIVFFEMLSDDIQKERYVRVTLSSHEIKELYKRVIEIEAKESEEFIDP